MLLSWKGKFDIPGVLTLIDGTQGFVHQRYRDSIYRGTSLDRR